MRQDAWVSPLTPVSKEEARSILEQLHATLPAKSEELHELVGGTPLGLELIAGKLHTHSPSRLLARFRGRSHRLRARAGGFPLQDAVAARLAAVAAEARSLFLRLCAFEGRFRASDVTRLSHGESSSDALLQSLIVSELVVANGDRFVVNRPARDFSRAQKRYVDAEAEHTELIVAEATAWFERYDDEECREIAEALTWRSGDLQSVHGRLAVALRNEHATGLSRAHTSTAQTATAQTQEQLLVVTAALERLLRKTAAASFADALTVTIELSAGGAKVRALLLRSWNRLVVGGDGLADASRASRLIADASPEERVAWGAYAHEAHCLELWCRVCAGDESDEVVDALLVLSQEDDAPQRVRAEAYAAAGRVYLRQGRWAEAEEAYEAAIEGMREHHVWRVARLLYRLATVCFERGDLEAAKQKAKEAYESAGRLGDEEMVQAAENVLALVAAEEATEMRDVAAAFTRAFASLERLRGSMSPRDIAFSLRACGKIALMHRLPASAFFDAAIAHDGDTSYGGVRARWLLALSRTLDGNIDEAQRLLEDLELPNGLVAAAKEVIKGGLEAATPIATKVPPGSLGRLLHRLQSSRIEGEGPRPSGPGVCIDGSSFVRGAEPVVVQSVVLRRVLGVLLRQRLSDPLATLSTHELFDQVWPDDDAHPDQRTTRVYVAIHELRQLGLHGCIISTDGYRLSSEKRPIGVYLAAP